MASRKTIEVEKVKGIANRALEASMRWSNEDDKYVAVDRYWRQGVMLMVEKVLMDSGNYKGFGYLTEDEVPKGELPGIRMGNVAPDGTLMDNRFENTDNTRVRYF
ncbi:hypothetical protein CMI38_04285 [Candidatus Pacearchaeota archaeon]|jgi:hypothetical protein|nr:hypothetical protein [Candidatus Pacearchaeota archaeon]